MFYYLHVPLVAPLYSLVSSAARRRAAHCARLGEPLFSGPLHVEGVDFREPEVARHQRRIIGGESTAPGKRRSSVRTFERGNPFDFAVGDLDAVNCPRGFRAVEVDVSPIVRPGGIIDGR